MFSVVPGLSQTLQTSAATVTSNRLRPLPSTSFTVCHTHSPLNIGHYTIYANSTLVGPSPWMLGTFKLATTISSTIYCTYFSLTQLTDVETVESVTSLSELISFSRPLTAHTDRATSDMPEQGFHCFVSDISEGASSSADSDVILYVTTKGPIHSKLNCAV